jgi:hypothetical protein
VNNEKWYSSATADTVEAEAEGLIGLSTSRIMQDAAGMFCAIVYTVLSSHVTVVIGCWVSNGVLFSVISSAEHLNLLTVFYGCQFASAPPACSSTAGAYWLQIAVGVLVFTVDLGCIHLPLTN